MPELEAAEKRRRSWLDAFLSGSYLNELVTRETLAVDEQVVKRWHAAVLNNIEGLRPMLTPFEGATSRVAGLVASVERGHTGEAATDEEGGGPDAAEESAQDDSRHPASSRARLRNDTINGVPIPIKRDGERRQLGGNANATWRSILMDAAEGPETKSDNNRHPTKSSPPPPSLSEEEEEEKEEEEEEEAASAVAAVGSADSYGCVSI